MFPDLNVRVEEVEDDIHGGAAGYRFGGSGGKEVSRTFLTTRVIPTIKAKWPTEDCHQIIYIQQDDAKTHVSVNDKEVLEAAQAGGWDIRIVCQPPNSPMKEK